MKPKQFEKYMHKPVRIILDDGKAIEGYPVENDWKKYHSSKSCKIMLVPFGLYTTPDAWGITSGQWFFNASSVKSVEQIEYRDMSESKLDLL